MSTDVDVKRDPMAQFKEDLKAKVRDNIRDLLPGEAVASLVEQAVKEQFFDPVIVKDRYGGFSEQRPSWFAQEVAKAAEPIIREAVEAVLADKREEIDKAIAEHLSGQNLTILAVAALGNRLDAALFSLSNNIMNRM